MLFGLLFICIPLVADALCSDPVIKDHSGELVQCVRIYRFNLVKQIRTGKLKVARQSAKAGWVNSSRYAEPVHKPQR